MGENAYPRAWYPLCRSRDVGVGRVRRVRAFAVDWAVFRGADGVAAALRARCPHMGADLAQGSVDGGRLRCALHGRTFAREGAAEDGCRAVRALPVREAAGIVFGRLGGDPAPLPLPTGDLLWSAPTVAVLRADWRMIAVNGFDVAHLPVVHRREVIGDATFAERDGAASIAYRARVAGSDWQDRLTRLSGVREVVVDTTCWGGSHLLFHHHRIACTTIFALQPIDRATTRAFIVTARIRRRSALLDRIALAAFHRGIVAFVREDRRTLAGAVWDPTGFVAPADAAAIAWAQWLARLPHEVVA